MGLPVAVGEKVAAADINSIANLPVANFASLPATGNWLGRRISTSDNGLSWMWSGSAWVPALQGLVAIAPTSVAGAGVVLGSGGLVTFTAASSVSLNGCFTSAFANYKIVIVGTAQTAASGVSVRLRAAGVDASAANYSWSRGFDDVTARTVFTSAGATSWVLSPEGANYQDRLEEITLANPGTAARTIGRGVGAMGSTMRTADYAWQHSLATAYDGLSIFTGAGTFTGTVKVYGYN